MITKTKNNKLPNFCIPYYPVAHELTRGFYVSCHIEYSYEDKNYYGDPIPKQIITDSNQLDLNEIFS